MVIPRFAHRLLDSTTARRNVVRAVCCAADCAMIRPIVRFNLRLGGPFSPGLVESIIRSNYAGFIRVCWADSPTADGRLVGWFARITPPGEPDVLPTTTAEDAHGYRSVHRRDRRAPVSLHVARPAKKLAE